MGINVSEVPTVGTAGHTIGNSTVCSTEQEKRSLDILIGCPINGRCPTKMSKSSFIRMCLKYQKYARKGTHCTSTFDGWKSNFKHTCPGCETGKKVENEEEFEPSEGIEFIDLKER